MIFGLDVDGPAASRPGVAFLQSGVTPAPRPSTPAALALAAYVAVSWTWVIGMFLPVLLVRDFGGWGWVAFAVPNVIGAAAVGWWWRTPRESAAFVLDRLPAVAAFSVVTLALQCFALAWIASAVLGGGWGFAFAAAGVIVPWVGQRVAGPAWAAATWLASATVGVVLLAAGWFDVPDAGLDDPAGLAGLAAACGMGFALCPHLDVTLHAARQATPRPRLTFGVGFGVLFLAMIALTFAYATKLPGLMLADFEGAGRLAGWGICVHLLGQVCFTNAAHLGAVGRVADAAGRPGVGVGPTWLLTTVAAAAMGWTAGTLPLREVLAYAPGELIYRGFLTFYGLIFPAALLVGSGRRFWTCVLAAAPFFAVGFFGGAMAWSAAGIAVLLVGWGVRRTSAGGKKIS